MKTTSEQRRKHLNRHAGEEEENRKRKSIIQMITAENINVYNNKILIEQPNEADVNIFARF